MNTYQQMILEHIDASTKRMSDKLDKLNETQERIGKSLEQAAYSLSFIQRYIENNEDTN